MLKNKLGVSVAAGGMALVGMIAGTAFMVSAQSTSTTTVTPVSTTTTVDTPEKGDVADVPGAVETKSQGHSPLGGDGVVSSITGTTIVVAEESDEGSASYTIDASKATVTNNGVAGTLADIKVGTKIFVQGTTSGTNVVATSISIGHPGNHADKADGAEGADSNGANDPTDAAGSSDTSNN